MKDSLVKVLCVVTTVSLLTRSLPLVENTSAYLNDAETFAGNTVSVGTLFFSLISPTENFTPVEIASDMIPNDEVSRDVKIKKEGSLPIQYSIKTEKTAGADEFCQTLNLQAWRDGELKYNAGLLDFNLSSSTVNIGEDGEDDWSFRVKLPQDAPEQLEGKLCDFDFVFTGWQDNLNFGQGLSDEGNLSNSLESGLWIESTDNISPIADAYVLQQRPDDNLGGAINLRVKSKNPDNRRTFIKFDFHFPSGIFIQSAFLKLFMHQAPAVSRQYEARLVEADWAERNPNGINWNNQPSATNITDLISTGVSPAWLSWNVLGDVQDFINNIHSNYGWRISDTVENSPVSYEGIFRSREAFVIDQRPVLEISFIVPEATTTFPVINEIYPRVDSNHGSDPTNEWVEIYNPTSVAVDISGWQICDNSSCDVIPTSTPITAKGFALISATTSTWNFWPDIPAEAVKIVLGSSIGNGLNSAGDRMILKNTGDVVVDAMSYGNDNSQLDPAVVTPLRGKSLARVVKGYDTNSANDWIINATPNPGTNPSASGMEIMRFTADGVEVADLKQGLESLGNSFLPAEAEMEEIIEEIENNSEVEDTKVPEPQQGITAAASSSGVENSGNEVKASSLMIADFTDLPVASTSEDSVVSLEQETAVENKVDETSDNENNESQPSVVAVDIQPQQQVPALNGEIDLIENQTGQSVILLTTEQPAIVGNNSLKLNSDGNDDDQAQPPEPETESP